ncbi:MAG TPA: PAS domain S-box protein, partial [Tahibacter sp.]|uniref:PAS domain S-box protein n=1 Tax=Tahibacter sp. TaxID=2056211 RepID=UPI002BD934EF
MPDSIRLKHGTQWLRRQSELLHLLASGAPRERMVGELVELLRLQFPGAAIALSVRVDGEVFRWSERGDAMKSAEACEGGGSMVRAVGGSDDSAWVPGPDCWTEPLHDVDGQRIGELHMLAGNGADIDAAGASLLRVGATIAELIFQRDSALVRVAQGRELYRSLLDNHPDAVLHIDPDGRIQSANAVAHQLFGRSGEELVDEPVASLFDEQTQAALALRLPSVLRGIAQSMEAQAPRLDGARARELELILVPPRGAARSRGLFVIAHDVTRLRASERALRRTYEQSLSRRDQLLELSAIAIDSAAIDSVDGLALQLARSMLTVAQADFVRLSLRSTAAPLPGAREALVVLTQPDFAEHARHLPLSLRARARDLLEPQRAHWASDQVRGHWLGMSLRGDDDVEIGTLEWFSRHDGAFDDDDAVLQLQFARIAVSNVQRIWLQRDLREAERGMAHQLAFVRAMTASIGEGLYAIDRDGRLTFMNRAASDLLGWHPDELQDGIVESRFAVPDADSTAPAMHAMQLDSRMADSRDFIARDGRRIPVELVASPLHLDDRTTGAVVVFRDVSERLRAEQAQLERDRFFALSLELFVIVDTQGRLSQFNAATTRLVGRSAEEIAMQDWRAFVHPDDIGSTETVMSQLMTLGSVDGFVNRWVDAGGGEHWLEWTASLTPDRRIFAVARDITERRRYENELAHFASHDAVTGLPRVEQVEAYLAAALAAAALRGSRVSVFYLDLDRFHLINDTRGHAIGDQVLHTVAERLLNAVHERGTVARISGDEFLIVRADEHDGIDQQELGESLRLMIERPISLGQQQVFLTCSVGVSCFPENGTTAGELIQQSEAAMIKAKDEGRNTVASFSNEQAQALKDRRELGAGLRDAIANEELVLHFQPQIGAHDWQVRGVEALVRWNSPQHGLLPPGRFIPVAEELGIIVELGQWVLETACRKAREWLDNGLADFTVAINVSALQLQ